VRLAGALSMRTGGLGKFFPHFVLLKAQRYRRYDTTMTVPF